MPGRCFFFFLFLESYFVVYKVIMTWIGNDDSDLEMLRAGRLDTNCVQAKSFTETRGVFHA